MKFSPAVLTGLFCWISEDICIPTLSSIRLQTEGRSAVPRLNQTWSPYIFYISVSILRPSGLLLTVKLFSLPVDDSAALISFHARRRAGAGVPPLDQNWSPQVFFSVSVRSPLDFLPTGTSFGVGTKVLEGFTIGMTRSLRAQNASGRYDGQW